MAVGDGERRHRRNIYMVPAQEETYGFYLRRLREERGLTQEQVAESVGTTQGMISAYELGKTKRPDPEIALRIDALLELEPGSLMEKAGFGKGGKRLVQQAAPPPGSLVILPDDDLHRLMNLLKERIEEDRDGTVIRDLLDLLALDAQVIRAVIELAKSMSAPRQQLAE